ncbi:MAG: shikimate dehydrogenase, partial [Pelagibacteraceae bacterium]
MKNFLVIGNPIQHSLSPKLHNFWINQNNIDAHYEKKQIEENEISKVIQEIKDEKLSGINITVPYKKSVIPFLEELSETAKITQSVNTVYKQGNKIVGDNTDVVGFIKSLEDINLKGKSALILGAGGVVSSIIHGCHLLGVKNIFVSNRTESKVDDLITLFPEVKKINWGENVLCDLIINSTSVGLKKD